MVKSWLTIIAALLIMAVGTITEQIYVRTSFNDFKDKLVVVYNDIENETATKDEVIEVQNFWIKKKEKLHIFIPHTEIKEIDLWIAESCTLVENKKYDDALSKIDVVIELVEQIPKTFLIRIENIF